MRKKLHLLLLLLGISYLHSPGQNFSPFSSTGNYTWLYNTDSLYTIRIDSITYAGSDTSYWMNTIDTPVPYNSPCSGIPYNVPAYERGNVNLFGRVCIRSGNDFLFLNNATDTIFLKPFSATPWLFKSDTSLTALVTGTYVQQIGGVSDSIIEITISDGNSILLSQNHGIAESINFSHYFNGNPLKTYSLFSIEGDTNFVQMPVFKEVFDFDIGDEFHYQVSGSYTAAKKIRHKIISKSVTAGGNQISYSIDREILDYFYAYSRDTITETYDINSWEGQVFELPDLSDIRYNNDTNAVYFRAFTYMSNLWNGRIVINVDRFFDRPSCPYPFLFDDWTVGWGMAFAEGLGMTSENNSVQNGASVTKNLIFYKKGTDSAGTKHTFVSRENNPEEVLFELYPNPANHQLTLQGIFSGSISIEIYDIRGKLEIQQQVNFIDGTLMIDISNLSDGIYFLLARESGNLVFRKKVLKVSK